MQRLLVVDDEERIRDIIKEYIREEYQVEEASNGVEALNLFKKNEYALVILDIMMPNMDGWSVCRNIRKSSSVPIIMLTARGEEYDKLFGFELGVDDYIVKPFSPKELLARIKAIIRRSNDSTTPKDESEVFYFDGLVVKISERNVYVDERRVELTPKEFDLLAFLVRHPNKVFTRAQLLDQIWGYDFFGDERTVDTHIKMLRESIKPYRKYIVTVWGTGYKFEWGV